MGSEIYLTRNILRTLNTANAFVMSREAAYLNGLVEQFEKYRGQTGSDDLTDQTLCKINKEQFRLSDCDKWDEEEVRVSIIVRRGKLGGNLKNNSL